MKRKSNKISYEATTGVRFAEWTVPARPDTGEDARDVMATDRWWQSPYSVFGEKTRLFDRSLLTGRQGKKGPRPLADIALRVTASHLDLLQPEHLASMQPRHFWRLYGMLVHMNCLHLGAWKRLLPFFTGSDKSRDFKVMGAYVFRQHICHAAGPLSRYTTPIICPSFSFISHLCLTTHQHVTTRDLLSLSSLPNLGVLQIIEPAENLGPSPTQAAPVTHMSDSIVRGWIEGDTCSPFPVLRVLRVWGTQSLTSSSIQWLTQLPALAVVDLIGACGDLRNKSVDLAIGMGQGWSRVGSAERRRLISTSYDLYDIGRTLAGEDTTAPSEINIGTKWNTGLGVLLENGSRRLGSVVRDAVSPLYKVVGDGGPTIHPPPECDGHCDGSVKSESWAFWMHSLVGQLGVDFDLGNVASLAPLGGNAMEACGHVLPSVPIVSLRLGHGGSSMNAHKGIPSYAEDRRLHDTARIVLVRRAWQRNTGTGRAESGEEGARGPKDATAVGPSIPNRKRQKMSSLLDSFQSS